MMGNFEVRYTDAARDDLFRLFGFLLDHAQTDEAFEDAQSVIDTLTTEIEHRLARIPFIFRKVGNDPFLRELVIPCRSTGYVALCEIEGNSAINILAVRHQREEDYH